MAPQLAPSMFQRTSKIFYKVKELVKGRVSNARV